MQRIATLRGFAVLALLALGACSDTARSPLAPEAPERPLLNTYPAPTLSVANSGGYPLISWSALSGATRYSVTLAITETHTNRVTAESTTWRDEQLLGTTTGTSFLDSAHPYTGVSRCSYLNYPWVTRYFYQYEVTATFANGTSMSFTQAPVATC